ncbi:MAG: hypothetical protein KDA57_16060 [Planctomycetales bacterium]|nr:hypothetical protein [Planctomycetales bacterium]
MSSKAIKAMRWLCTASLLLCWSVARLLGGEELLFPPSVVPEVLQIPAPEAAADATENDSSAGLQSEEYLFSSTVISPAYMPPCSLSAISDAPRPIDAWLEAVPRLLSVPNKNCGDCLAGALHSHRVEVPTRLDATAYGLHPVPERPLLLMEWGEEFLGVGPLAPGIETCSGAVWRPAFWVFGEYRTALQYADYGGQQVSEWANRLDLFGQLNLSGTERVLAGLRPADEELVDGRRFSSLDLRDGSSINGFNSELQTLFFEGDFGELFPYLDPHDVLRLDYGFSVGRMPLLAQQGLLINEDRIDAVTVTRNTLFTKRISNLRMTGVYAWGGVHRNSADFGIPNTEDRNSHLLALLTESDFACSTANVDVVYVQDNTLGGDLLAFGASSIRRQQGYFNTYNTSLHVLGSFPTNGESPFARQGELLFAQTSWTPHHYDDLIYLNAFLAIDEFTSPARGPLAGGPLGQTGLLFSAPGIGRVGAPINVRANDAAGASLGYQYFFDETRQQVVWEFGGQQATDGANRGVVATGVRYQRAVGHHWITVVDMTVGKRESDNVASSLRFEARAKF